MKILNKSKSILIVSLICLLGLTGCTIESNKTEVYDPIVGEKYIVSSDEYSEFQKMRSIDNIMKFLNGRHIVICPEENVFCIRFSKGSSLDGYNNNFYTDSNKSNYIYEGYIKSLALGGTCGPDNKMIYEDSIELLSDDPENMFLDENYINNSRTGIEYFKNYSTEELESLVGIKDTADLDLLSTLRYVNYTLNGESIYVVVGEFANGENKELVDSMEKNLIASRFSGKQIDKKTFVRNNYFTIFLSDRTKNIDNQGFTNSKDAIERFKEMVDAFSYYFDNY